LCSLSTKKTSRLAGLFCGGGGHRIRKGGTSGVPRSESKSQWLPVATIQQFKAHTGAKIENWRAIFNSW